MKTILVVDDDAASRRLVRDVLTGAGYAVVVAANGMEAISAYDQIGGPVDLVLTDLDMPGMNGVELIKQLRGRGVMDDVRPPSYLLMTGHPASKLLRGFPAELVLTKPFKIATLLEQVRVRLEAALRAPL